MLSPMSAASSVPPAHGFLPDFFKSHAPNTESQVRPLADGGGPRTSYLPERDGSHAEFCSGDQFARYREQMRENLDFIIARAKQLGMPDAANVEQDLNTLYLRRFEEAYYDTHAELIDSAGKRALDNFCAMLDDERLSPDNQRTAIGNLSQGVTVCASGTVANLIAADRDLSLSAGGMRSKLWRVKEDTVRNVLQELISQRLGTLPHYVDSEIHLVNAAWNYMADVVGLEPIPDLMAPLTNPGWLTLWQDKVLDALSPDRLARRIAEDCLSEFRGRALFDPESPSVPCDQAQTEWLNMVLTDLLRGLGLTESELNLHAFVYIDDDGQRYHIRDDPSLIALALLKVMNADHLLADTPVRVADIGEREGAHIALYSYGADLAWRLRQSVATAGAPAWEAHDDVDAIDEAELRAWIETQGPDAASLPQAVVWKLIHSSDQEALMGMLPNWLGTTANVLGLLRRLQPVQALQYLEAHSEYLRTKLRGGEFVFLIDSVVHTREQAATLAGLWTQGLGRAWRQELDEVRSLAPDQAIEYLDSNLSSLLTRIPPGQRAEWVAETVHMGEPGRALARAWYPNPWALLGERDDEAGHTCLEHWIESDNIRAIDAVFTSISKVWSLDDDTVEVRRGIYAAFMCYDQESILHRLANSGSANAIDAMHHLLNRLLSGPRPIREQLTSRLTTVFRGGVCPFLQELRMDASVIQAIHRMIINPSFMSLIAKDVPAITTDGRPSLAYPMCRVLNSGDALVVKAYGALLVDLAGVPGMETSLVQLTMPTWGAIENAFQTMPSRHTLSRYALLTATESGDGDMIKEYHAILVNPAILPHIQPTLAEIVPRMSDKTLRWYLHQRRVLNRLFDTQSPGHQAYFEMAKDPLILPHVLNSLPWTGKPIRDRLMAPDSSVNGVSPARRGISIRNRIAHLFRRANT